MIKIATNSSTYQRMRDNMDVNAGAIADGETTVAEVGREIFDLLLESPPAAAPAPNASATRSSCPGASVP